jgi:predicted nucleic acid-binding protein
MDGYIFDTNIFNKILDGIVNISTLSPKEIYVTHIQFDELQKTPNTKRRIQLEKVCKRIIEEILPTESTLLDVSRLGFSKLSDGVLYEKLLKRINEINKSKKNNCKDILIAETAIINGLILVTNDHDLHKVTLEFNGSACMLKEIIK